MKGKRRRKTFRISRWALLGAIALVLLGTAAASAQGDPYTAGSAGYDVSYPNCGASPSGAFGIAGVNGGRPFSANGCLRSEYAAASNTTSASLYINTGYSGAYRKSITTGCSASSSSVAGSSSQQQAWAIGCSEAETSLSDAAAAGASSPAMWWLDVETGNSWSTSNLSLNRYALQGATTRLAQTGLPVGAYSTAYMWKTITGAGFTPSGLAADWVAGGTCASAPFTSSPVWLAQTGTSGGVDSDTAC